MLKSHFQPEPFMPPTSTTLAASPTAAAEPSSSLRDDRLSLWDWRRQVAELYNAVRTGEPRVAWDHWRATRDRLFRVHPQSPLAPTRRAAFAGLLYFDYDPRLRFAVALDPPESATPVAMAVGRDGAVLLTPFGRTRGLQHELGGEV